MPSLILEQIDTNDDRRKDETENWIEKLESRFEIEKRKYINIEVVFRQLVMHEKMATGFVYENDEPFPLNKNLKENIERHLWRIRSKNNYGFHRLTFEKKDRIKSAEQTLKSHYADINKLKELSASLRLSGSLITIEDIQSHIEELKIRENKKMERAILVENKLELKKFIKISPKGEIVINAKAFDFIRVYALLMYALMEPYFLNFNVKSKYGINGYIAQKLNFEFGSHLGFRATSKIVADRIRDNNQTLKLYKKRIADLGLKDIVLKI